MKILARFHANLLNKIDTVFVSCFPRRIHHAILRINPNSKIDTNKKFTLCSISLAEVSFTKLISTPIFLI